MSIDESIEGVLKDENAQAEAVKSLINVKDKDNKKLGSDIELKTDLTENDVVIHTAVDMMNRILSMDGKAFSNSIITQDLVQIKERKLLSKNRQSRKEIVEIAKNPEMQFSENPQQSFVKRLFTPRQKTI